MLLLKYMIQEYPPENEDTEVVERFEDHRELSKEENRKEQRINDIIERAIEEKPSKELSPKDEDKIAEIEYDLSINRTIEEKVANNPTGAEAWSVPVPSSKKPTNKFRNFVMAAKIGLAGLIGLSATKEASALNNFEDSTKNKTETNFTGRETVNDNLRQQWNNYVDWTESKGLKGDESLDKAGLGYKLFDEYVATHDTELNREKLKDIRIEFLKLRAHIIQDVKEGKANFEKGLTEDNLLKSVVSNEKTGDPVYPGSKFGSLKFPKGTTVVLEKNKIDYNAVANKSIDSKLEGKINNVMSKELNVKEVIDEGFVKTKNETKISYSSIAKNK